jgi:hypoxanthine phosphoribosyltransferase
MGWHSFRGALVSKPIADIKFSVLSESRTMASMQSQTMSRGPLKGLQYVSYAGLARDIREWSQRIVNPYKAIAGIPRSGMTCAHMLAAQLNLPCFPLGELSTFRQSTGRPVCQQEGKILVIDDACSYGTAINEARRICLSRGIAADFAAVYSRECSRHLLDLHPYHHEEPDHLVVFEWNWMYHQDRGYIAVTQQAAGYGLRHFDGFHAIYDADDPEFPLHFKESNAMVLFAAHNCSGLVALTGKPVVDIRTGVLHQ